MATSNVDYYQKQKDLQDSMNENEQKRKRLEAQLEAYCRSDQKMSKLRAVKLQSYWKKICEDEKRSKQRNSQLLRDLDRVEANMAALSARREKLKQMKQQYFDYIERTYPKWNELVIQKKQEHHQQQQDQQQQQRQLLQQQQAAQQEYYIEQQQQGPLSNRRASLSSGNSCSYASQQQQHHQDRQHQDSHLSYASQQQQQHQDRQHQDSHVSYASQQQQQHQDRQHQDSHVSYASQQQQQQDRQYQDSHMSYVSQQQQEQQQQQRQHQHQLQQQQMAYQQNHQQYQTLPQEEEEEEEPPPPLPRQPPPVSKTAYDSYDMNLPEREYANIKDIKQQSKPSPGPTIPSVTVHMPRVGEGDLDGSKPGRPDSGNRLGGASGHTWMAAERDTSIHSFSEQDEVPISQPVQSVTVRQKSEPVKTVIQPTPSEEDVSEFSDEPDLPSMEVPAPVPTQHPVAPPTDHASPMTGQVHEDANDDDDEDEDFQMATGLHPEVSSRGLQRLLKQVELELGRSLAVEAFYRARNPDPALRKDIIYKANGEGSLESMDGEFVSMVILEQLTPVVRRLPGSCLLSDILLVRKLETLTEAEIRNNLHRDSQLLWDQLLEHFVCLVTSRAMGTREIAHVFVPCLVHDSSQHQDKAVAVLERVLDKLVQKKNGKDSPVPQDSLTVNDTLASSQQGGVPRLKFGSLVDSNRAISDEESSMITQSMNTTDGPKVPLNETEAYKNLLAGNRPVQTAVADDTDNSDNDLEKQFVSTLSPRSHASKPPFPHPSTDIPSSGPVVRDESHDQSHDQEEPHSEVSSPLASPVYVPTGAEASGVKSILGSTGGSSQQRKLAGMISSDLDTDTEVDIGTMGNKKDDDDDDFYDFYG